MNDHDEAAKSAATERWKAALLWSAILLVVLVFFASLTNDDAIEHSGGLAMAMFFALKQDIPVGGCTIMLLAILAVLAGTPTTATRSFRLNAVGSLAILSLPAILAFALRGSILADHDLSRDERMANFDAAIFAKGHLFEPLPKFWRPFYSALNDTFLMPIGDHEAFVSNYLPGNAALRALIAQVLPVNAVNPLLLLAASLALWRLTRRFWPDSASTRAVVMIVFGASAQPILAAATSYAMTAHLALNLVWLVLFFRGTWRSHAAAILVGFVATGLHQPVFHPIFVAPFMLLLARNGRWRELAAYGVAYAAIGLFWMGWQPWIAAQAAHPAIHATAGVSILDRFLSIANPPTRYSFYMMAANLLRLVTWNHLLLLPLAGLGIWSGRANREIQALWLGIALLVVFMTFVLPSQINGWGYRYLHGFLGSAALLAGTGWHWLEQRKAAPVLSFVWISAFCALAILPLHVWMARGQINAYAAAAAAVQSFRSDVVIVDTGVPFTGDLVFNRADLSNRPILLDRTFVHPSDLASLCAHGTIAFADAPLFAPISRFFGIPVPASATPQQQLLKDAAVRLRCTVVGV